MLSTIKAKLEKAIEQKSAANDKLIQLCGQISNLIPKEIQEPLQNIITLSVTLKREANNLELDKRHIDYISKIYLSSLKLNAQIIKAFDKGKIIHMVNNLDTYVPVNKLVSQIRSGTKDQEITFNIQEELPQLAIKSDCFVPAIINYLKQHEVAKSKNLKIDIFQDYLNNLIFAISGNTLLPIFSEELEHTVNDFNGEFHIQDNDGITYHIITFPNFLLK